MSRVIPIGTVPRFLKAVAKKHQLDVAVLQQPGRGCRKTSAARQEAMYRLYTELGLSSTRIGQILGGRAHTTILHGINAHKQRRQRASA